MKKFFIIIFFLAYSLNSNAHMAHYNKFNKIEMEILKDGEVIGCLLYTSPSPRDGLLSRMPSSA